MAGAGPPARRPGPRPAREPERCPEQPNASGGSDVTQGLKWASVADSTPRQWEHPDGFEDGPLVGRSLWRGDQNPESRGQEVERETMRHDREAKKPGIETKELDAWLIWNIWQVANTDLADLVPITEEYQVYRDAGSALTQHGKTKGRPSSATPVRWTRPSASTPHPSRSWNPEAAGGQSPGAAILLAWSTPPHKVPHAAIGVPTSARSHAMTSSRPTKYATPMFHIAKPAVRVDDVAVLLAVAPPRPPAASSIAPNRRMTPRSRAGST